ncbi:MAG: hypothetical protein ACOX2J_05870 [Bacillota bacterium]
MKHNFTKCVVANILFMNPVFEAGVTGLRIPTRERKLLGKGLGGFLIVGGAVFLVLCLPSWVWGVAGGGLLIALGYYLVGLRD